MNDFFLYKNRHSFDGMGPIGRYLSGMCYIDRNHLIYDHDMAVPDPVASPALIIFGGNQNLPQHDFLDDQWILTLQHLDSSHHSSSHEKIQEEHSIACKQLL